MLDDVMDKAPFRLIGVGISGLDSAEVADQFNDLLAEDDSKKAEVERATDVIRERFGKDAVFKGRGWR